MMKFITRAILILAISNVLFLSCAKDKDDLTNAVIILTDSQNRPVEGMVVYAYSEDTWKVIGDNPLFANGESASISNGHADFPNLEYVNCFRTLNNFQNTFRFSVHYTLNSIPKTKVLSITFKKGDSKTETMILN